MQTNAAQQLFELDGSGDRSRVRVWRPFPTELSDLLCVESANGAIGPWIHARVAIVLVRSRSIVRVEGRRSVQVQPNSVVLVPESQVFSVRSVEDAALPIVCLLLGSRWARNGVAGSFLPGIVTRPELVASASRFVDDIGRPVRSFESASGLAALVPSLLLASAPIANVRSSGTATSLAPLRDYLIAHVGEPVSIATLATVSGLTESHCIRAFHYEFGLPPHAYHLRLRLALACDLLARGQSVSTVAYDCGFADQSHLSRKFKEVYGVAPGAWSAAVRVENARRAEPVPQDSAAGAGSSGELRRKRHWVPAGKASRANGSFGSSGKLGIQLRY